MFNDDDERERREVIDTCIILWKQCICDRHNTTISRQEKEEMREYGACHV
jgi:hypothetical protein